jgi:hypothetical protein
MSMQQHWDDEAARKAVDRAQWKFIGFLIAITTGALLGLVAYEDYQQANETCAERQERRSEELGVPMLYDPRTGLPAGCTE